MFLRWSLILAIGSGSALLAADVSSPPSTAPAGATQPAMPVISLHLKDVPLREAFERFAAQGHVALRIEPGGAEDFWVRHNKQSVTLDIDQLPYWQALHELCVQTGIAPGKSAPGMLSLRETPPAAADNRPSLVHGLLQIEAGGGADTANIVLGNHPKSSRSCHIWFEVRAVPEFDALRCDTLKLLEFTDQTGKPIELEAPCQPGSFTHNRSQLVLDIKSGPDVRAIKKIKGELRIVLHGTSATVEVENILKADKVERQVGTLHFLITTQPSDDICEVNVDFSDDRKDEKLWQQANRDVQANQPKLLDAQGRSFNWAGGATLPIGEFALHTAHRFRRSETKEARDAQGEPVKFVWEFSTSGRMVKLPFEFKDLPLQ